MGESDPTVEPGGVQNLPAISPPKGRKAFSSARRSLTEKELSSPATALTLIDEIERLEGEKAELADYREKFHEADKTLAVLQSKTEGNRGNDIVFGVALSTGFGAIGYAPSVWTVGSTGPVILAIGAIVVVVGIVARVVRK